MDSHPRYRPGDEMASSVSGRDSRASLSFAMADCKRETEIQELRCDNAGRDSFYSQRNRNGLAQLPAFGFRRQAASLLLTPAAR